MRFIYDYHLVAVIINDVSLIVDLRTKNVQLNVANGKILVKIKYMFYCFLFSDKLGSFDYFDLQKKDQQPYLTLKKSPRKENNN